MARLPRRLIVLPEYQVHKIWRGHNREWNLKQSIEKLKYLHLIDKELGKSINQLHAIVLMSNHSHEIYMIDDVDAFSDEMRRAHGSYGMFFNKLHKRCGKVAQDRPKTCMIENDDYAMRATFYIHANPLRAGIVKNAASYPWSTHAWYAYGKPVRGLQKLRYPEWYMALGKTMQQRQQRYRQYFDAYLKEIGLIKLGFHHKPFYGSPVWQIPLLNKIHDWRAYANAPP